MTTNMMTTKTGTTKTGTTKTMTTKSGTTKTGTYPLRLPLSLKAAVEKLAKRDGASVNQFVVVAVAEKLSAMATAEMFAERRARADMSTFDLIMNRGGGEPPRPDDML